MLILLDSKPLGMVTNPKATPETDKCNEWLDGLLVNNVKVRIPEIIDGLFGLSLTRSVV